MSPTKEVRVMTRLALFPKLFPLQFYPCRAFVAIRVLLSLAEMSLILRGKISMSISDDKTPVARVLTLRTCTEQSRPIL